MTFLMSQTDDVVGLFSAESGALGSLEAVTSLVRAQLDRNLLLLRLLQKSEHPAASGFEAQHVELLRQSQESDPDAFAAALCHPQVSRWLSVWISELDDGAVEKSEVDGDMAAIAAAVAWRCGQLKSLPAGDSAVTLPGVGHVTESGEWQGLRQLHYDGELRLTVDLDDLSVVQVPQFMTEGRLYKTEFDKWQVLFDQTCRMLEEHHRSWLYEIAAVYRSLIPVVAQNDKSQSVTYAESFGSCVLTCPVDAVSFAETLVHELQHNKFNALLTSHPMTTPDVTGLLYSPWRPDPRPLPGHLHGIFAFFGVAQFWRSHRLLQLSDDETRRAEFNFAYWRLGLQKALVQALESVYLTQSGHDLFAGIQRTVEGWMNESVSSSAQAEAVARSREHEAAWKARNT